MEIYLFEDTKHKNFFPLAYFRPVFDLKCGALTLKEKFEKYFNSSILYFLCRNELKPVLLDSNPKFKINELSKSSSLFINGRVIADLNFIKQIKRQKNKNCIYIVGDSIAAAYLNESYIHLLKNGLIENPLALQDILLSEASNYKIHFKEINVKIVNYAWDLIRYNGDEIINDFKLILNTLKKENEKKNIHKGAHLLSKKNIIISKGAIINPGVVLDATEGPIIIGSDVNVMPNSVVLGPTFIGNKSIIKINAKIYSNTSIGKVCKIGGEIDNSIIQSYSNKQHDGYLGHAYVGSWVNIGAGTNNSDLKNNYSTIKVVMDGKLIDTGMQHFGMLMGEHTKTGINMMFDSGTVIGIACSLYGSGFPRRFIPSFSRGNTQAPLRTHMIEMAIQTAKLVMKRRQVNMTKSYEKLFRRNFELTEFERRREKII